MRRERFVVKSVQAAAYSTDRFVLPLPDGHRFPMEKYRLVREEVSGWADLVLQEPPAASDGQLALAHHPSYVDALVSGTLSEGLIKAIGFPWSPAMVERSRRSTGATIAAARSALAGPCRISFNLAGGTHHASHARGEGFCCFNDAAVAARLMQAEGLARRVAILDLDVHQGNGTAEIFAGDPTVMTLSVHGEANFPFEKARSDWDCGLADGAGDEEYLLAVEQALLVAQDYRPDLLIFLAGADPLEQDRLGRLRVSLAGLAQRDARVFHWAASQGLATAVAMAGGYARPISLTVAAHLQTIRLGLDIFLRIGC